MVGKPELIQKGAERLGTGKTAAPVKSRFLHSECGT